jgi:hypothetical protein
MRPVDHLAWEALPDGSLMVCHLPTGAMLELSSPAAALWTRLCDGASLEDVADQTTVQSFCRALRERGLLIDA